MLRPRRSRVIVGIVLFLAGAEVGFYVRKAPVAKVKIVNPGDQPIRIR